MSKSVLALSLSTSLLGVANAAQTNVDIGVQYEGTFRALAQACGGAQLLKRVTDSGAHFNHLPHDMSSSAAESAIRKVQYELSTVLVGDQMTSVCTEIRPKLSALVEAQESLFQLKASKQQAKPDDAMAIENKIFGEKLRYLNIAAASVGAVDKIIKSKGPESCKPRVVRCDYTFPDGRTDWTYPNSQGRCPQNNQADRVQEVRGIAGDLAEVSARCKL